MASAGGEWGKCRTEQDMQRALGLWAEVRQQAARALRVNRVR
jgi:hypothetical protein